MRAVRRALDDHPGRSDAIWTAVDELDEVRTASTIMAFTSIHGEPLTAGFIERHRSMGQTVALPEDAPPPDPASVDVVLVPATALTPHGDRLGQGGGWYDRFLADVDPGCTKIGVCFDAQLVEELPTEPHDVRLDVVVTELGAHRTDGRRPAS
jgi:5-formyltetrahydrofolate cyclo-ligase